MSERRSIWIGFDPREAAAYAVARDTAETFSRESAFDAGPDIRPVNLAELRRDAYWRPTSRRDGRLWDDISAAPMSTEFAISRFLTPWLAGSGLALFMDGDVMIRQPLDDLFAHAEADPSKAVWCVQHQYDPSEGLKMDGQLQTAYARKNWSSVMLFNVDHPANQALTPAYVNTFPGRDLHAFNWLRDDEIGELDPKWNFLVGHSDPSIDPAIVHFTEGVPFMPGYENQPYADEWFARLNEWAR